MRDRAPLNGGRAKRHAFSSPSEDDGSGFTSAIAVTRSVAIDTASSPPPGAVDHAEVTGWMCNVATAIPAPPELDET
jgi:hypothetical protein